MKKTGSGGFVGILSLLIVVAIMIFLMVKGISSMQESTGVNNSDKNAEPGGGLAPINAAKNAKNIIEKDNARSGEELK